MSAPVVRPSRVPCGRCRASTALEWMPAGGGDWSGMGRCPACGAGVLSIFSEGGIHPDDLADLLRSFSDDDEASAEAFFRGSEQPKKGGFAVLIA